MKLKIISLMFIMVLIASSSFAGSTLSGGDTKRNPVLGVNFAGGYFSWGPEVEVDFRLSRAMSLAPRIGLFGFNSWSFGAALRFGIIEGKRPHGFWVGPCLDIVLLKWTSGLKWNGVAWTTTSTTATLIVPGGEFGWRYTFDFGLSLQAAIRLGVYLGNQGYGNGFAWDIPLGIGYAF